MNCNRAVTWLSLDDQDNDKNRFLLYLIAALKVVKETIGLGVWDALHAAQPLEINNLLIGLLNEITEINQPFVLVLDDYHSITEVDIHEILIFILENQPPNMHLIISSRSDPPWPLARFRARQEMTEIRIKELRFTHQEVFSLLNSILEIELSMQDVMILDARIEGWIAGWQLAAISLQGRVDVSEFINSFTSSHRFIFDYLLEEIFEGLPSELQDFLLKTSILERLSAPLCNAVMGKKNSHLILDHLEQMNLFIIPMDDQRKWYRYHHLFGTLLVGRLKERFPDQISDLHLRASFWFGTNGEVWDSVRHAFSAGDVERVAQVAEVNVLAILERGELGILIRWLEEIPDEIIASYPWSKVAEAWALANAGLFDAAISCLLSAELFISDPSDLSQSEKSHVSGHFAAIRCYVTILTFGDYNKAVQLAQLAVNELPNSDHRTRGTVTVYLGTLQRIRREFTLL